MIIFNSGSFIVLWVMLDCFLVSIYWYCFPVSCEFYTNMNHFKLLLCYCHACVTLTVMINSSSSVKIKRKKGEKNPKYTFPLSSSSLLHSIIQPAVTVLWQFWCWSVTFCRWCSFLGLFSHRSYCCWLHSSSVYSKEMKNEAHHHLLWARRLGVRCLKHQMYGIACM